MSVTLPQVIMRGLFSSRPAANSAGSLYFASDTGKQYRDNGISWDEVTPTGSSGTVSSVALTMPAEFSVSGSPVTSTGTLAVAKATQSANLVYAGPITGSAAAPTFRAVVPADLPLASSSAFGAVKVDGTTITAASGVISAGSSAYIVAAGAFSGGGSALTSGSSAGVSLVYCAPVPRACTAIAWTVTVDQGTAGFRVWRKAAGTAIPTVADTITSADLAISSGTNLKSTTFTNFTGGVAPTFAVGDIIAIQLNAAATATYVAFSLVAS